VNYFSSDTNMPQLNFVIRTGHHISLIYAILIGSVSLISILGCTSTRQLILEDLSTELIFLPFKIDSIVIVDARDSLMPMNWDVPLLSAKKRKWEGNPPLSQLNRNNIVDIINRSSTENGIPAHINYSIVESICSLQVDWKSVTEYAKYKAQIIIEIPSRNLKYTSTAQMHYDHPTMNGTEKGCMRLYNQAVKNVTHIAINLVVCSRNRCA